MSDDRTRDLLVHNTPRKQALIIGALLGIVGGVIGGALSLVGPIYTGVMLVALAGAVVILSRLDYALWAVVAIIALLPYGALPVKIVITPTFLDLALAAVFLLYMGDWMTGKRRRLSTTPVHPFIILFMLLSIFSFVAGLRYAGLTSTVIRRFAELLLSISFTLLLVDILKTPRDLRQFSMVILIAGLLVALLAIGLWILPDDLAASLLQRLSIIGYPDSGVIRYIEENPELPERAIATTADPNSLGGLLVMLSAMALPQAISEHPITRKRWHGLITVGLLVIALILTFSRGSLLAFACVLLFVAALKYRKLLAALAVGGGLFLVLPWTQYYVTRLIEGFQLGDLATQMRLGEYADALRLISRYPLLGVGFSGTPDVDLYLGVSNVYLLIASNMGLMGLAAFMALMAVIFLYALRAFRQTANQPALHPLLLGYLAGLVGALANGIFDHYFFNLSFHPAVTILWIFVGLTLASARLIIGDPKDSRLNTESG
nr:O-antigen ligase family protein [Anaerolineae bacterium]